MKLLRIDSSARESSISRQLTSRFVESWKKQNLSGVVIERDLGKTPLPHITDDWAVSFADPSILSPAQRDYLSTSDRLVDELIAADVVVVGAPMHNFTVTWELKAWIDQIVRLGKTVTYGDRGPRGLLGGKKVVVITARGGAYSAGSSRNDLDFQEPYLRSVFRLMGLTDITFIHAENQYRRDGAEPGRAAAIERIEEFVHRHENSSGQASQAR